MRRRVGIRREEGKRESLTFSGHKQSDINDVLSCCVCCEALNPAFISKRSIGNYQTPVVLLHPTVLSYLLPLLIPADVWLGVAPRLAVHHNCVTQIKNNSTCNRMDYWGSWREREGGKERNWKERMREGRKERGREE